jgi:hypothetical protein
LRNDIKPYAFWINENAATNLVVKAETANITGTLEGIRETWNNYATERPFEYFFLDEQFRSLYKAEENFQLIFTTLTCMAIYIACSGLFARAHHVDELQALLEARLCTQPGVYWLEHLLAAEVPCAPINKISQVLSDPQVQARNMVVSTFDPVAGEVHMAGNPIKISGFEDPTTRQPAPDLDGDREHILRKL